MFNMELMHETADWPVESSTNPVPETNRSSATRNVAITNFNFNDDLHIGERERPKSSTSKSIFSSKRNSDSYSYSDNQSRRVSKQNKEVSLCKCCFFFFIVLSVTCTKGTVGWDLR